MARNECENTSSLHRVVQFGSQTQRYEFFIMQHLKKSNFYILLMFQPQLKSALWLQLPRSTFQHSMLKKSSNTIVKECNLNHVRTEMKNGRSSRRNVGPGFCCRMQQSAVARKEAQVHIPAKVCNPGVNCCQTKKYQ